MRYSRVFVDAIGYELAPIVVTSRELEARLEPVYRSLRLQPGQLEAWTGIAERRWWERGYRLSDGASEAARNALEMTDFRAKDIDALIYAGVCREQFEPATACRVAAQLGISPDAFVFDVSNACLGVLNGMVDIANRIELGQIRAGIVVSCESSREINELTIGQMLEGTSMEEFTSCLATLTGGSGAVAVLLTDGSFNKEKRRQLLGGATQAAPEHHGLCRWGLEQTLPAAVASMLPSAVAQAKFGNIVPQAMSKRVEEILPARMAHAVTQFMATDSISVLRFGVELGCRTWRSFLTKVGLGADQIDKVICHQVGQGHRDSVLKQLGIPPEKDFSTFRHLGNIGTVSLPLTAAMAEERDFLRPGDQVGFLGIGSGLNCLMLGLRW